MKTRRDTNKVAHVSIMPDLQERRRFGLPKLQRISVLTISYKIVSNIVLNRIKPYTRAIIGEYQSSIMPGKSTVDQIHTIKQIVDKSHEFDLDVYLLFVDFKQANDSVNRDRPWKAMIQLRIPAKLVRLVKACVQHSKCKVKFNGELSEDFSVETGLR